MVPGETETRVIRPIGLELKMSAITHDDMENLLMMASGEELASFTHGVLNDSEMDVNTKAAALDLVNREIAIRRNEPFMRKTSRFLSKNGGQIASFAIGALLGCELGD